MLGHNSQGVRYFSLANQCVEALFEHYNYKICFFGKVTQTVRWYIASQKICGGFRKKEDLTRISDWESFLATTLILLRRVLRPTTRYTCSEGLSTESSWIALSRFTNGDWCPGGPAREIKVKMRCGANLKLISVKEPSRCKWVRSEKRI